MNTGSSRIARSAQNVLSATPISSKNNNAYSPLTPNSIKENNYSENDDNDVFNNNHDDNTPSDKSDSKPKFYKSYSVDNKSESLFSIPDDAPILLTPRSNCLKNDISLPDINGHLRKVGSFNKSLDKIDNNVESPRVSTPKIPNINNKVDVKTDEKESKPVMNNNDKEKQELLEALEILKMQNEMLSNRIKSTQKDNLIELEKERNKNLNIISKLENENSELSKQLMVAKEKAEKEIQDEKNELLLIIKNMEQEKNNYNLSLEKTEGLIETEAGFLKMKTAELTQKIELLEKEKIEITSKFNETVINNSIENEITLDIEKNKMNYVLEKVALEKELLQQSLKDIETQSNSQKQELLLQLSTEKRKLAEVLRSMEMQKNAVTHQLKETEEKVANYSSQITFQLNAEREEAVNIIKDIEKQQSNTNIQTNTKRLSLIEKLKEKAKRKLEKIENTNVEYKKDKMEKITVEKQELKRTVSKMKNDYLAELKQKNGNNSSGRELKLKLSSKSLFDMMSEGGNSSYSINPSGYSIIKRSINNIEKNSNANKIVEESFMDDDEDNEEHNPFSTPEDKVQKEEEKMLSELPAPHSAAAKGDLTRLKQLEQLDLSLLNSLDSVQRRPLFYATAYGHEDIIRYLLELFPYEMMSEDLYGDCVLHAASSAEHSLDYGLNGNTVCADACNKKGMSPAHLALTPKCLEALFSNDGNLALQDNDLRSPLFVACAINREDCAEFIIGCLDQIEVSLVIQDTRGDTPLHAAACNGSTECVLLLLQYGVDPRLQNHEGFMAVDLAQQNNQTACVKILAEYYLHYCTSSEFDSVLFLATLEGHKMINEMNNNKRHLLLSYQLINNSSQLDKKSSLFSMKTEKSLRIEKWGAWLIYHDHETNSVFYYNHERNIGQWEKPSEITYLQDSVKKKDGFDKALKSKMSMRLKKNGDWISYITERGKTFYYNQITKQFQWEDPESVAYSDFNSQDTNNEWKAYMDEATQSIFWYNVVTNQSQWECPFDNNNNNNNNGDDPNNIFHVDDHDAIPVDDENDLGL